MDAVIHYVRVHALHILLGLLHLLCALAVIEVVQRDAAYAIAGFVVGEAVAVPCRADSA